MTCWEIYRWYLLLIYMIRHSRCGQNVWVKTGRHLEFMTDSEVNRILKGPGVVIPPIFPNVP